MIREPLPFRRDCTSHALLFGGGDYVVGIGRFADGHAAEIFISSDNPSSEMGDISRDGAVLISIALQCGVPAIVMRDAVTRTHDGVAASIIGAALDLLVTQCGCAR